MTKNEYNEITRRTLDRVSVYKSSHLRRVLSCALEIARTIKKCDTDMVIAGALTHELNADGRAFLGAMFMWDDEKLLTFESIVSAMALPTSALSDEAQKEMRIEAKILRDAHRLEECGVIGAACRLLGIDTLDEFTKAKKSAYDGFHTRLGAMMAKKRRSDGDAFDSALTKEIQEMDNRLEENLDATLRDEPIKNRLSLIKKESGFRMEGYFVWCGSVIYDKGEYHMFASRWRENLKFPSGYMVGSEIVHATSPTPEGPYTYKRTVISQRPRGYWDSQFQHNPQIVKCGDTFVLFYNGAPIASDSKSRRIGYATTKNLNRGTWVRSEKPIDLGREDCNNPAAWVERDGSIKLAFRYGNQRIGVARAKTYDGEYEILNPDILPDVIAEDPFLWRDARTGMYRMIVEDGRGKLTGSERFGALLESEDCIFWRTEDPVTAYDHTLMYDDLSMIKAERRERPQLLFDNEGNIICLYTATLFDGKTWNTAQRVN